MAGYGWLLKGFTCCFVNFGPVMLCASCAHLVKIKILTTINLTPVKLSLDDWHRLANWTRLSTRDPASVPVISFSNTKVNEHKRAGIIGFNWP